MATTGLIYEARRPFRPRSRRGFNAGRFSRTAGYSAVTSGSFSRTAKRALDMAVAVAALVAGMPFAMVVALMCKLTSPGPVLFSQERVGQGGRLFTLYKFRTLPRRPAFITDRAWTDLAPAEAGWFGRLLRRTGMDEWPQFWNVLRGDMSVVGPRPERAHFAQEFSRRFAGYDARHAVKPGITGWAQVRGWRGDTDIAQRLACDLCYIRDWSLSLDLRIMLYTPAQVLRQVSGTHARLPFRFPGLGRPGGPRRSEECTHA